MRGAHSAGHVLQIQWGGLCIEVLPDNARPQQITLLIMRQIVQRNVCAQGLRVWGAFACQGRHLHCRGKGFALAAELQNRLPSQTV